MKWLGRLWDRLGLPMVIEFHDAIQAWRLIVWPGKAVWLDHLTAAGWRRTAAVTDIIGPETMDDIVSPYGTTPAYVRYLNDTTLTLLLRQEHQRAREMRIRVVGPITIARRLTGLRPHH